MYLGLVEGLGALARDHIAASSLVATAVIAVAFAPARSGLQALADAAHNLQASDPARASRLLLDLRADLTAAIADIRRLVYDLRPPDLDELGLVSALRQRAEQSWRRPDAAFTGTIDAPSSLPPLPAAVEAAAYRIATEAVTNALRHAGAGSCRVTLTLDSALHLEVTDDGAGGGRWRHGVGLRSMHERAAELGGTLTAGPTDRGGRVHARLPLEEQPREEA